MFDIEETLRASNLNIIMGLDEVGKGSLFGPVTIGCVILPVEHKIEGIKDSKKFSGPKAHQNRLKISQLIIERSLETHIVSAPNTVIDQIGILKAVKLCMLTAINECKIKPDIIVIDGDMDFSKDGIPYPYMCVEKADSRSENVAAASIIAKARRDSEIIMLDPLYPNYGLAGHKGYGSAKHMEAINKFGPCELHRKNFMMKGKRIGDIKPNGNI